ncbi:hypothetical protein TNCV_672031 [Trichonephila clavipes]|nr:hypothetical protein TNCV_672031 [Trichonephila clavipes]
MTSHSAFSNGRILNRGLSSSYSRTGGNSQIGETSLFSTADRAKSTDYSSKDNSRILPTPPRYKAWPLICDVTTSREKSSIAYGASLMHFFEYFLL